MAICGKTPRGCDSFDPVPDVRTEMGSQIDEESEAIRFE